MFLGAPRSDAGRHARESGAMMRGAMLLLAAACVAIGLAPAFFWPLVARAAESRDGAWTAAAAPASLFFLGWCDIGIAVLAATAGLWFWRRTRQNGPKRAPTWDCGYSLPTARMQYTAGSFAGIITEWFAWILRPVLHKNLPTAVLPAAASYRQHTPEAVLEYGVEPAGGVVMRVVQAVRRLQHGRVQAYLFYLLAGLGALAVVVVASEK